MGVRKVGVETIRAASIAFPSLLLPCEFAAFHNNGRRPHGRIYIRDVTNPRPRACRPPQPFFNRPPVTPSDTLRHPLELWRVAGAVGGGGTGKKRKKSEKAVTASEVGASSSGRDRYRRLRHTLRHNSPSTGVL